MRFLFAIICIALFWVDGNADVEKYRQNKPQKKTEESAHSFGVLPIFVIPEPFVVNLMGNNGRRYFKTSIALEMNNSKLQKEADSKLILIKDSVIRVLSSKTYEEVSTPKGKEKLKEEILQEINSYMVDGSFKKVLFSEFIIQ